MSAESMSSRSEQILALEALVKECASLFRELSSTESRGYVLGEMQSLISKMQEEVAIQTREEDAVAAAGAKRHWGGGRPARALHEAIAEKADSKALDVTKKASQWSRKYSFARTALIQLERVGSNKKSISEHGAGHCILKTLLQAHILKMQCVPALAAILHTWYAYRTLVTWFRNSGRSGAVPVHLIRFASPQLQGLSKMTNVLRGSGQKTLLESFLDVRSHDAFKLGPQPWRHRGRDTLKLDESIAAGERILGPRSELQFDAFMRKVFDTVWCNKRVSTVSAIRAMIITTASRCEERSAWWASGLSSFADLAGLLEQYVAEKEKFRADAVAAASGASRGQPPPKKPRFGTLGDVVSTSFSFSSGVAAVVESWAFVEHLSSLESSVSWEQLYVLFKEYGCKYSGSAFVASHTLENLVLMNHMHRRLPINLIDADKYFLVGLGPNTADFEKSFLADEGTLEQVGRAVMDLKVRAVLELPGCVLEYDAPSFGITMSNVQDDVCMLKKHLDYFCFAYLAPKNKYEPKCAS